MADALFAIMQPAQVHSNHFFASDGRILFGSFSGLVEDNPGNFNEDLPICHMLRVSVAILEYVHSRRLCLRKDTRGGRESEYTSLGT